MALNTANKWFNYYHGPVSDAKSSRLSTTRALCPGEATGKQCWVDLPDEDDNIRVGFSLLTEWTLCRIANDLLAQTQITVKIEDGECTALSSDQFMMSWSGLQSATPYSLVSFLWLLEYW
jgi:hypothetical protein